MTAFHFLCIANTFASSKEKTWQVFKEVYPCDNHEYKRNPDVIFDIPVHSVRKVDFMTSKESLNRSIYLGVDEKENDLFAIYPLFHGEKIVSYQGIASFCSLAKNFVKDDFSKIRTVLDSDRFNIRMVENSRCQHGYIESTFINFERKTPGKILRRIHMSESQCILRKWPWPKG